MRQKTTSIQHPIPLTACVVLLTAAAGGPLAAQSVEAPQAVSPGAVGAAVRAADSCPTFSWSGVAEATGYELILYRVDKTGALEQALQTEVPGDARAWTPSADACPAAGADYAWAVRGLVSNGASSWSEALFFQTPGTPSDEEVEQALETLRRCREGSAGDSGNDPSRSERAGRVGEGLAPSRSPDTGLLTRDTSGTGARRYRVGLEALSTPTASSSSSPQVVNPPASFALNLTGDVDLSGFVFKDGVPFIHNDGDASFRNTAVGLEAMVSLTPGSPALFNGQDNSAFGDQALHNTTSGFDNTAVGRQALFTNISGYNNVAVGSRALFNNATGHSNVAIGFEALFETIGGGHYNVAVGRNALRNVTSGERNIAVGFSAGSNWTTGDNNIAIGTAGTSDDDDTIRIGHLFHERTFIGGIRGTTTEEANAIPVLIDQFGQLGTISSSARFKEDIHDLGRLSSRLADLRPVAFRYRKPFAGGAKPIQFGLIAEEVAEAFPELVVYDEEGRPETVKYHLLSTLLLNEVQRQQGELEDLRRKVAKLAGKRRFRR